MDPAIDRQVRVMGTHSMSFVLAVPLGVFILWLSGLVALVAEMGECFGSDAVCHATWVAQQVHLQVLAVVVIGLTVLSGQAVVIGRRIAPAVLLAASGATLLLAIAASAARPAPLWWVPNGIIVTIPALLILALASAGQVRARLRPRRSVGRAAGGLAER